MDIQHVQMPVMAADLLRSALTSVKAAQVVLMMMRHQDDSLDASIEEVLDELEACLEGQVVSCNA